MLQFRGAKLQAFEVTATTCVLGFTATLERVNLMGRDATYSTKDKDVYFVKTGGTQNQKIIHNEGSASDIRIDRIPSIPQVCAEPTPNTPLGSFEVFSRTFAENYISFDLKKADWNRIVAESRQRITLETSPASLFETLGLMIEPFGDAHTYIGAPNLKRSFSGVREGTDRAVRGGLKQLNRKEIQRLFSITDRVYLKGPLQKFCNDQIQYGHVDDNIGYLRILSFNSYSKQPTFAAGEKSLESTLDRIFSDQQLKLLVIDTRINLGGDDPLGLDIASRLANVEYVAYTKFARNSVDRDGWTSGDASVVRPSSRPGFRGPIVQLIGPLTISAGETFTQALMGRTPHVTRIGENTQGVFSDVLDRRLPNGWIFGLPNEVYRTPEGTAFDGSGIPPDIESPAFSEEDLRAGRDPALVRAIDLLRHGPNLP